MKPVKRVLAINIALAAALSDTKIQNFSIDKDCDEIIAVIPDSSNNFTFQIKEQNTNVPWFEEAKANMSVSNPRIDLHYQIKNDRNMQMTAINQTAVAMTARVLILIG